MATNLTNWLSEVNRLVLKCTNDTIITDAIRDAVIQLAEEGRVHSHVFTKADTEASTASYDLTFPSDTQLYEVRILWYDEVEFSEWDVDALEDEDADWDSTEGTPSKYCIADEDTITLVPVPDTDDVELKVSMYVRPTEAAASVDDRYWNKYRIAIRYLAASLLLAMPGREWTAAAWSDRYEKRYRTKLADVNFKGPRSQHSRPVRRSGPAFNF